MVKTVLITGGNMGNVRANLLMAREMIARQIGAVTAVSEVMESDPWGEVEAADGSAPRFSNQVLVVETELGPYELLDEIHDMERSLGRTRDEKSRSAASGRTYRSRAIDIDILFYGDASMTGPRLTIPHPHILRREFVLSPLAAVIPDYVHPSYGKSIAELLEDLKD